MALPKAWSNESELTAPDNPELVRILGAAPLFVEGDWQPGADSFAEQRLLAQRNPAASTAPLYELYDAVRPSGQMCWSLPL